MPLSLVSYLKRPIPGLSGLEWEAYYDSQSDSDQSIKDTLEAFSKVAKIKGISLEDAMALIQEMEKAKTDGQNTSSLVLQNADIIPVLEEINLAQAKRQRKNQYSIAKIIVQSRLKPLFFIDNEKELKDYEIELTKDELSKLKEIRPHERLQSKLQGDIVSRLFGMLPESLIVEVQDFAFSEISTGQDSNAAEDKETDPLS